MSSNITPNQIINNGTISKVENSEIISLNQIKSPGNNPNIINPEIRKNKSFANEIIIKQTKKSISKTGALQPIVLLEKYTGIFRNWTLMFQILFYYCILMVVFVSVLIAAKIYQVNSLLEEQSRKNYYSSIVREKLDVQRNIKVELDKINNLEYVLLFQSPVLFFRIYSQELINHKLLDCTHCPFTSTNIDSKSRDIYNVVGDGFTLTSKLSELMKYDSNPSTSSLNFNNLIPFYYHLVPAFYLNLKDQGIPIVNFNFMGNEKNNSRDNMYFKFPLESNAKNDKIHNFIIDPISRFNIYSFKFSEDGSLNTFLVENATKYNWYYNYENEMVTKNLDKSNRLISLYHILSDKQRNDYYINYYAYKNKSASPEYYLHFSILINKNTLKPPFIIHDENGNTKNFDYLSVLTSDKANHQVPKNVNDKIYEWDYNIDDDNPMISYLPLFIKEFFKYSMTLNGFISPDIPEVTKVNPFSHILQYSKLQDINKNYFLNYYFEEDLSFFQLFLFLNNYFVYERLNPSPSNPNETNIYPNIAEDNRPCLDISLEHYYDTISKRKNCLEDFCFYNECNSSSPFYIDMEDIEYMPNCYCLPLYCTDSLSVKPSLDFYKTIAKKMGDEYDYSFNSPRKANNEYVNKTTQELKCRLIFYQKNSSGPSSFDTTSYIISIPSSTNYTIFILYLCNNFQIAQTIIGNFQSDIENISWIILIFYFILLIGTVVGSTIFLMINVQKLTKRMTGIKKSISDIIRSPEKETNIKNKGKGSNTELSKDSELNNSFVDEESIQLSNETNKSKENKEKEKKASGKEKQKEDELELLKKVIFDNQKDFKIDFDIHENINEKIKGLRKNYHEAINVVKCQKSLFPKRESLIVNNDIETIDNNSRENNRENNNENMNLKFKKEKEKNREEISLNVIYELFSLSTEEIIDLSKLKHNLYYREKDQKSVLNLSQAINQLEDDKKSYDNEMSSTEKYNNAMKYYYDNIHQHWKDLHKKKLQEEDL